MSATTKIIAQLNEVFAPMDAEVLSASQEWAKDRMQALRELKATEEYKATRFDAYKRCAMLHAIAGGKTWYNVFQGRNEVMVAEFVEKNCAAIVANRNASIAAKLNKAGVTEVVDQEFAYTNDGFNGFFRVNTNAGSKRVTINTIRAGGYNIQCLHLRVLVHVK